MTTSNKFPIMFKASSIFTSYKWQPTIASRVGLARDCDYMAFSIQLQMQLLTGTELGKNDNNGKVIGN